MTFRPPLFAQQLPDWLAGEPWFGLTPLQWGLLALLWPAGLALGALIQGAVVWVYNRRGGAADGSSGQVLLGTLPGPLRLGVMLLFVRACSPVLRLPEAEQHALNLVVRVLLIVTLTWFASRLLTAGGKLLEAYLFRRIEDPFRRRSVQTQISVPQAIVRALLFVVGGALVLLQFDVVRSVGVSLLASAGLAGVVIGLAAQRSAASLLAGLQLSLSQPIKIGDQVVVENEFGEVEEIGLTTVVVKLWDLRRLVLPVGYFLDKPIQNWSWSSTDVLGTVDLPADFGVSVEEVRAALKEVLSRTPLWDGRTQAVEVTALKRDGVDLRLVFSARDGAQLWALRCFVREQFLAWMQERKASA